MAEDRLKIWETLFQRALKLIDSAGSAGITLEDWSFGGGTVLMFAELEVLDYHPTFDECMALLKKAFG